MTDNSSNYQQVGVEVDEQSFGKLNQRVNDAANSMGRLSQANQSVADTAQQVGSRLQQAFASTKDTIQSDIDSIQQLRAQLTGAADDASKIKPNDNSGGGFDFSIASTLRRASGAASNLGVDSSITRPVQIAGDIAQIAKSFDKLGATAQTSIPALAGIDAEILSAGGVAVTATALIAIAVIGQKAYNDGLEAGAKALHQAEIANAAYYKAIENGSTDSIQKQLSGLQKTKTNIDAEIQNIQTSLDNGFKGASQAFGGDLGGRLATGVASLTNEDFRKLGDRLTELKKQSGDLDGQMQGLGQALDSATVKANDAAQAILKEADRTREDQINQYKLLRVGTVKQIQGIIDDNKDIIQADTYERNNLLKVANPTDDQRARIAALKDEIEKLSLQSQELTQNVLPLVQARELESQAEKDNTKAIQDLAKEIQKRMDAEIAAVDKYNNALQSIEDQAAQSRIASNQKLQDALVAAAQAAVDAAQKALGQLEATQQKNLDNMNSDLSKIDQAAADQQLQDQINFQRQETQDLQTHLDNLKQIRDRDKGRERDDLLNRNFRDLFALSEQKTQEMTSENERYARQEEQRQQALSQEEQDQQRAENIQRRDRLQAYQQANVDAQKQYDKEIEQAQAAKEKAIQVAESANAKELAAIRQNVINKENIALQAAANEIKLVQNTEDAKQQIFQTKLNEMNDILDAAQAQASQSSSSTSSSSSSTQPAVPNPFSTTSAAYGGSLRPGQPTMVNDRRSGQRESFNGVPFPPGLGLFIPAQSGYVNPGGSNGPVTVTIPITVNGVQDPATIGRMIDQKMNNQGPAMVKKVLGIK